MQTNINNLHENITKLKNDTEIKKSKIFTLVLVVRISNFYDGQNNNKPKSCPQDFKTGKKSKLLAIDQFFIYLSWLRNGFTTRILSWLFNIPKSTVSRYLVTWTNLLYLSLRKIVIWPSMPKTFKATYASTRCIIDCTEIFC